ncbi:MAG: hypothetical protein JW814_07005 [Candidatus Krumholzibacteriota bacterium]|nr:hypothetical protein [Candidatus Krumholzibacteriota bacterium]
MVDPELKRCPACGRTYRDYQGKWTLVCGCGHLLSNGSSPERLVFLDRENTPAHNSLVYSDLALEEDTMGKSVWIDCPACGNNVEIYRGKWTLVCACRRLLYLGSEPLRVQFRQEKLQDCLAGAAR